MSLAGVSKNAKGICNACGSVLIADVPFVTSSYVGYRSAPCPCGDTKSAVEVAVPRTKKVQQEWDEALGE